MGSYCLTGAEFLFRVMKVLDIVVMVVQHCEYTNATKTG